MHIYTKHECRLFDDSRALRVILIDILLNVPCACVLLNDNGEAEQWVMILLCWTLHKLHRCVHHTLVTFRLSAHKILHTI